MQVLTPQFTIVKLDRSLRLHEWLIDGGGVLERICRHVGDVATACVM